MTMCFEDVRPWFVNDLLPCVFVYFSISKHWDFDNVNFPFVLVLV
jgi:hypothetical protein